MGRSYGFLYKLGKKARPAVNKGKWVVRSMAGTEEEVLRAEEEVGRDLAEEVRQQTPVAARENAEALSTVGGRLRARLTGKRRRFRFEPLEDERPNAFALPGGYIFVTTGLLSLCQRNRDELAFLLGHEMGHVVRQHPMDRIMNDAVVGAAARAMPSGGSLGGSAKQVGLKMIRSAYSQDHELDADRFGVRLARAAGFDPAAAVRMLRRLQARAHPDATSAGLGPYFASHPPFDRRLAAVRQPRS